MRHVMILLTAAGLSACTMGYWPKVDGKVDQTKYSEDVRDCQTATAGAGAGYLLAGAAGAAFQSETAAGREAIDACMAKHGYRVFHVENTNSTRQE